MEFNPDEPITSVNHPACDHCDLGVAEVGCTCFDWPTVEDDHHCIVNLSTENALLRVLSIMVNRGTGDDGE